MANKKSFVLIVDDIQSNVEFIIDILTSLDDIEVHGVHDGSSTLEFVKNRKPDLILLDISMPMMDGFEVCQKLKANEKYSDIPIIFLTARVQKEDIVRGFELGAVDYISKPFNLSELISRVRTHIELGHKRRELQEINLHLEEKVEERTKQLVESNQKLSNANEKLSNMYDELSALDKAKNEFIAHINHELRTPLNGILGYTALLDEYIPPEEASHLASINSLVMRLIKVAEISLILTELRTVDNKINISNVILSDCLNKAIPHEDVDKKNVHVLLNKIDESVQVKAEPRLLSTCIGIILDNAIKYSPENGNIIISGRHNDKYYTVDISDEGPGFSASSLTNLFDLFSADNLDHRSHGFGIGLATAKQIIDLLGGKINIKNNNKGASVVIHLKNAR